MVAETASDIRHVFISFATEDRDVADRTLERLEAGGIRCWIAHRNIPPGESYARVIGPAVESSGAFLVFFSAASKESPNVLAEVNFAFQAKTPILPIRLATVEPSNDWAYYLAHSQWLDVAGPVDDVDLALIEDRLRELLTRPRAVPRPAPVAPLIYSSTAFRVAVMIFYAASLLLAFGLQPRPDGGDLPLARYVVPLSYGLTLANGMTAVALTRQYNALALFTIGFVQLMLVLVPGAMENPRAFLLPFPSLLGGLVCAVGGLVVALPLRAVNARWLSLEDWRSWLAASFGVSSRRGRRSGARGGR